MLFLRPVVIAFCCLLVCLKVRAQDVYKTPSGAKYHEAACRMVKNTSSSLSLEEALQMGLQACKICHLQSILPAAKAPVIKPSGEASTVRCAGLTKTGTRCLHRTKIANGYCYQHQPK